MKGLNFSSSQFPLFGYVCGLRVWCKHVSVQVCPRRPEDDHCLSLALSPSATEAHHFGSLGWPLDVKDLPIAAPTAGATGTRSLTQHFT